MRHSSKKEEESVSEANTSNVIEHEVETPVKPLEKSTEKIAQNEEEDENELPRSRTYPRKPEPASVDLTPEISGIEIEDPKFGSTTNLED